MLRKCFGVAGLAVVIGALLAIPAMNLVRAQGGDAPACDLEALVAHQREHASDLDSFAALAEDDLAAALEQLYTTGIAYQSLAVQCGLPVTMQAQTEAVHAMAHTLEDHHDSPLYEVVTSIGDPVHGAELFYTFRAEVGFACATCHYPDRTDRLVGPGLLGVGNPAHDHAAHDDTGMDMDDHDDANMDMDMDMDDHDDASMDMDMDHQDDTADDHSTTEGDHTDTAGESNGMDEHNDAADHDDTMMEVDVDALVERAAYLQTSIREPGAFIVPDFPDMIMPRTYGEILSEQDINDLVAYLLTLQ